MVHKTWKPTDEKELVETVKKEGFSPVVVQKLAKRFDRSPEAIVKKLQRLGLNVVGKISEMTTTIESVKDLPSLEEVLKVVAGALKKATEPGLGKTELQRLDTIANLYKAYVDGLERYVRYRDMEQRLLQLEEKYAKMAKEKAKGNASE